MVKISRQSQYIDSLTPYEVYIDDISRGFIIKGETRELDIENGEHSIFVQVDWCKSNKLIFTAKDNELIEFNCGNALKGLKRLFIWVYFIFLRSKYLFIERTNDINSI